MAKGDIEDGIAQSFQFLFPMLLSGALRRLNRGDGLPA
jgi:hypothetical protein